MLELKKTLKDKIDHLTKEIARLNDYIETGKNADLKVCYTRLSELQQRLSDLQELNQICVERNRY